MPTNIDIPDFSKLLRDLLAAGWTQRKIADRVGVSQAHVSDIYRERVREPGASFALQLIDLHKQEMRKARRRERAAQG